MFQTIDRPPADYSPFAALPVRHISVGNGGQQLAVHISGRFTVNQLPLICVPGFNRNMTDYTDFMRHYRSIASVDWPIVLIDLCGRGRASFHGRMAAYSATTDAHHLSEIARALGISKAIFMGEGHGGQAIMALSCQHPGLIAGAVLVNSGPTPEPQGLVRLRSNMQHIADARGASEVGQIMRQILSADYPGLDKTELDRLAARSHFIDKSGRAKPLFDPALMQFLARIDVNHALEPQWPLFDAMGNLPLMLVRTQFSDQLGYDILDQMVTHRPSAIVSQIIGEGAPALMNNEDEVGEIADFIMQIGGVRRWTSLTST